MKTISFYEITPDELVAKTVERVTECIKDILQVQDRPEEYLTAKETAKLLKISSVTLNDYCKREFIPSYRVGGTVRFKRSEIDGILTKGLRFKYKK
jgi:excisionase family DNA binding protein